MARVDELRLITRIARLYYERGQTQSQIAEQLDLSQAKVSRLLKRAEAENIVRITINQPQDIFAQLEESIEQRYGIREVIVADAITDDGPSITHAIGSAAAYYVETTVMPDEIIGISSWSGTLLAMVDAMAQNLRVRSSRVVQVLGGIGNPGADEHATQLTRRLAERLNGNAIFLPAPGVLRSSEQRSAFVADPYVSQAMSYFDMITLALIGIGSVEPSATLAHSGNVFAPHELNELRKRGAVGDLCLRFIDATGQAVVTPLDDRVIGLSLSQIKSARRCVGVAGGRRKYIAIRAALLGHWINVLITDRFVAERLASDNSVITSQ